MVARAHELEAPALRAGDARVQNREELLRGRASACFYYTAGLAFRNSLSTSANLHYSERPPATSRDPAISSRASQRRFMPKSLHRPQQLAARGERPLLERILDTPHLGLVVP